eukprot:11862583-Karenia_brevis.AAC.1
MSNSAAFWNFYGKRIPSSQEKTVDTSVPLRKVHGKRRTFNQDVLHGLTEDAVSDREDDIDNLSDVTSETERSDHGDLWNMTCCEED